MRSKHSFEVLQPPDRKWQGQIRALAQTERELDGLENWPAPFCREQEKPTRGTDRCGQRAILGAQAKRNGRGQEARAENENERLALGSRKNARASREI
jgi:hypothetical protein